MYLLRYFDMTTGDLILQRTQDYPDYRAYLPGLPVRVECVDLWRTESSAPSLHSSQLREDSAYGEPETALAA